MLSLSMIISDSRSRNRGFSHNVRTALLCLTNSRRSAMGSEGLGNATDLGNLRVKSQIDRRA
jgi:hypothetical protein